VCAEFITGEGFVVDEVNDALKDGLSQAFVVDDFHIDEVGPGPLRAEARAGLGAVFRLPATADAVTHEEQAEDVVPEMGALVALAPTTGIGVGEVMASARRASAPARAVAGAR